MKPVRLLALIMAALNVWGPAGAVPAMPPRQDILKAYVRAISSNELSKYAALFSSDAKITTEISSGLSKADFVNWVGQYFVPYRRTRVLAIVGAAHQEWGPSGASFMLTVEEIICRPPLAGCYPTYRVETLMVKNNKITQLVRYGYFSYDIRPDESWGLNAVPGAAR